MNRGGQVISEIVESCRAHEITGLILVHEHCGQCDGLIVCHLPLGPIAYFRLLKVVTQRDIKDKKAMGKMSEGYPHLMLGNFTTKGPSSLEGRFGGSLLSLLSPPPLPRDAMDRGRMHCKVWKPSRSSCPRGTARRSAIHRDDEEVELSTIKLMPCSSFSFLLGFASPGMATSISSCSGTKLGWIEG
ncbi:hypothetical protein ACQJBY_070825 [Aegilops geniculata]